MPAAYCPEPPPVEPLSGSIVAVRPLFLSPWQ